jgi:hypothetical protein
MSASASTTNGLKSFATEHHAKIWVCISATEEQPMTSTDASTHQAQSRPKSGGAMMRMTIAVAALIVVIMLRPRSSWIELSTAAKPTLQELHTIELDTTERDLSLFRYFGSLRF